MFPISPNYPVSRLHSLKILSAVSTTLFLTSLIALTVLASLSQMPLFRNTSSLILYLPPTSVVIGSLLLGLLSLKGGHTPVNTLKTPGKSFPPPSLPKHEEIPPSIAPQSVNEASISLPIPTPEPIFKGFQKEAIRTTFSPVESVTLFVLLAGDFMGLDLNNYPLNTTLSLSFLIDCLEKFKNERIVDPKVLDNLNQRFRIAHTIASYQKQLHQLSEVDIYQQAEKALSSFILETLKREKNVLIPSGYAADPSGHEVLVELFLEGESIYGKVSNWGEGTETYHYAEGEPTQYFSLLLDPIPLKELEKIPFFPVIFNLNRSKLLKSETEYECEKDPLFTIYEIYEVLLPLWPGKILPSTRESHHNQYGGSCTFRPYFLSMKEALGPQDGNHAKMFLGCSAFQLLLSHPDFHKLDLERVEDALERWNRFAVSLDRSGNLHPAFKEKLFQLTYQIKETAAVAKKNRRKYLLEKEIDLEGSRDFNDYSFSLSLGVPMEQCDGEKLEILDVLLPFTEENFAAYLTEGHNRVQALSENNQLRVAKLLAHQMLLALPNPSDAFWESQKLDREMVILESLVNILLRERTHLNGMIRITPNEAILYLKVLTLSLSHAETAGVDREVVNLYGNQTKKVIEEIGDLYHPTHPVYAAIFSDCRRMLQTYVGEGKRINIIDDHKIGEFNFSSLSEMRENVELDFLYRFLCLHTEFFEIEKIDPRDRLWGRKISADPSIAKPLGLSSDFPFYYPIFRNLTIASPKPEWNAVRQFNLLRSLHYHFLFASYFSGEAMTKAKDDSDFTFRFSFDIERNSTVTHLSQFKTQSDALPLFSETFYSLPSSLNEWLTEIRKGRTSFQNAILLPRKLNAKDHALTPVEVEQLLSINLYDELMISQLVHFFTRHFYRLRDIPFQALFANFLFSFNRDNNVLILQEVMQSSSFVKNQLFDFLKLTLKRTHQLGWHECFLFFLRTLAQCTRYLVENKREERLYKQTKSLLEKHMQTLLKDRKYSAEIKGKILYTLVSCTPYFDHPKLFDLIPLCQRAKNLREEFNLTHIIENSLQWEEDYALGDAYLKKEREARQLLPQWIVRDAHYLFKQNFTTQLIKPGLYEFHDQKGELYRIATQNSAVRTYKKIDDKWYEYKNLSPFTGKFFPSKDHPCVDGYLVQNVRLWRAIEGSPEALVVSLQKEEILCRIKGEGIFHPTSSEPLRLATDYNTPLLDHLARIASKKNILAWKNSDHKVVRIEIPLYDLAFYFKEGKWRSSKHPSYFLDLHPLIPSLEPYSHYLVLCNSNGKRIAILPCFKVKPKRQNALEYPDTQDFKDQSASILYTFALDKKGDLKAPKTSEETLYLIYLSLHKYDYALAQYWVHYLKREAPLLNAQECAWILAIETNNNNNNIHPEAIALRLQLRLLQLNLSSVPLQSDQISGIEIDYFLYLQCYKHTFAIPLSNQDEKSILKICKERTREKDSVEDFKLDLRASLIDSERVSTEKILTKSIPTHVAYVCKLSLAWIDEKIFSKMQQFANKPRSIASLVRPGSALIDNFLFYYKVARHVGPEESDYAALIQLLRTSRLMQDPKLLAIHHVLLRVAQSPEKFPSINELTLKKLPSLLEVETEFIRVDFIEHWRYHNKASPPTFKGKTSPKEFSCTHPKDLSAVSLDGFQRQSCDFVALFLSNNLVKKQEWKEREVAINQELAVLEEIEECYPLQEEEDASIHEEFNRLKAGLKETQKALSKECETQESPYLLNCDLEEEVFPFLEKLYEDIKNQAKEKKSAILEIIHTYPESLKLEENAGMLRRLSFKESLIHFGTGNDTAFYTSNPSLDAEKLRNLKLSLTEYLVLATDLQQLNQMKKCKHDKERLMKYMTANRVYDPIQAPHLLIFEYFGKIRLHQEQYDALIEMTGTEEDLELEARTGFGKSKVLIPLWLFIKSLKDKASLMVVPASLLIAQHIHLKKILGKAYHSMIVVIQFNRSLANDPKYIRLLRKQIEEAKNKKILLTTVSSLHGMTHLKLKEAFTKEGGSSATELQTELRELRKQIETQVTAFFDESKECFNIRQRYDYAVGQLTAVETKQISYACSLYRDLFFTSFPQLEQTFLTDVFNFEFLPSTHAENKLPLLQKNYDTQVLPLLALKVMNRWEIPEKLRQDVFQDLRGNSSEGIESFYTSLSEEQLAEYEHFRKQLTQHLRRTLFRKGKDGYGFYPGSRLAIPFIDGIPKLTSEFTEVEDFLDFTIQLNLKHPFTVDLIETYLSALKVKALEIGMDNLKRTEEYQLLLKLHSIPLMELSKEHILEMTERLNNTLLLKLDFIEKIILPQIKTYQKKIIGTSFNLARPIFQLHAASGTVRPETLPPRLKTKQNKTAVIGNLMALWKNSQKRIFTLSANTAHSQLLELLTEHSQESVLIDVAGLFRDLDLNSLAQLILEKRGEIKGVLLYDDEGREWIYEKENKLLMSREESLLSVEELFIFIRKAKSIGTDIEMLPTAEALITADRDSYFDFVFQGVGRMRKLSEKQKVGFVFLQEDARIIFGNKDLLFRHFLDYIVRIQGKQKGEDAFYVLGLYLEDLIEAEFWKIDKTLSKTEEAQRLFKDFESFLVKVTQSPPFSTLHRLCAVLPDSKAVQWLKNRMLTPLRKFLNKYPNWSALFDFQSIEEQFENFARSLKLPKEVALHRGDLSVSSVEQDITLENEQTTDETTEITQESEELSDRILERQNIQFSPAPPYLWDGDYRTFFQNEEYLTLLNLPVYFSPNFCCVSEQQEANDQVQKPAYQVAIYKDEEGDYKILLLDLYDARSVLNQMLLKSPPKEQGHCYLFSGACMIACEKGAPSLEENEEMIPIHLIHKLFTATTFLTEPEKLHLRKLHSEQATKTFYEYIEFLLSIWPHLAPFAAQCKKCIDQ